VLARARAGSIGLTRAVTGRGRAFIATGIGCLVAAQVVGERDLLRVGALLILLPIAALAVIARTRYRLELIRSVTPSRVEAGAPARVLLRLENVSRLPSAVLLMEDTVPYALGGRPRFVLRQVEPSGVREAVYTVRPETRGRYEVGPLTVRLTDPFGCVELSRAFSSIEQVTVTPPVQPLPSIRLGGDGYAGGEGHAARAAVSGEADVATREYRQGDDLRKVHWRSTAKRGELMVRRDEQPRQNRATLLLDTRSSVHRGSGAGLQGSSFEWAVSACASIAVWLARRGYLLQLVTTGGIRAAGSTPAVAESNILELLSIVTDSRESAFRSATASMAHSDSGRTPGLVVAIVAVPADPRMGGLDGLPPRPDSGIAVAIDTGTWGAKDSGDGAAMKDATRVLAAASWRVVRAGRGDALADLWPQAGIRSGVPTARSGR
jgi:uncharacterized protein (DUF58 family)